MRYRAVNMEPFVRNFIRSSLLWLGAGVLLGLWAAIMPERALVYRPAHVHANLLGFVSMMVFGVAYHVMPRFVGVPLWSRRVAGAHLWIANAGLLVMFAGWLLRPSFFQVGSTLLGPGAVMSAVSAFLFIVNIWRTLGSDAAAVSATPELVQVRRTSISQRG
jgi:cytochrome c oxidase cbb3-type subunit 1